MGDNVQNKSITVNHLCPNTWEPWVLYSPLWPNVMIVNEEHFSKNTVFIHSFNFFALASSLILLTQSSEAATLMDHQTGVSPDGFFWLGHSWFLMMILRGRVLPPCSSHAAVCKPCPVWRWNKVPSTKTETLSPEKNFKKFSFFPVDGSKGGYLP